MPSFFQRVKHQRNHFILAILCSIITSLAFAKTSLQISVADSDGPPIAFLADNRLTGGLSKEIGEALAHELGTNVEFIVVPRKRIEPLIEAGKAQITCNANPKWYKHPQRLQWTKEIYPQVERLISLKPLPDIHYVNELTGKKISTIRGYTYPALAYLWLNHRASHLPESRLELMIRAIQRRLADVAVVSELEFAYWAKNHPIDAQQLKLHPITVTSIPTMCAVSQHSSITVAQLNQAIDRLHHSGQLKAILKRYSWGHS